MRLIGEIKAGWTITVILLSYLLVIIGGINVWLLLRVLSPIKFKTFIRIFISSWAMGLILPGQLGDASQVLFLKRTGVQISRSGAAYALDKGLTLIFLSFIASIGTSYYVFSFSGWLVWLVPIGLALFTLLFFMTFRLTRQPRDGYLLRLYNSIIEFQNHLLSFGKRWPLILLNFSITFGKWCLVTACYWSAFMAFNNRIPLRAAGTIPIMSTLIGYIPISVGGIGTVEWSAVYLFSQEGLSKAIVLATYLVLRAIQYLLAGISVIVIRWGDQIDDHKVT